MLIAALLALAAEHGELLLIIIGSVLLGMLIAFFIMLRIIIRIGIGIITFPARILGRRKPE
ncbi:MAG TPA: hypothetical protein DCS12_00685 [Clostridiales bacterium]|nr:hypothetical protein [Clostridiales bacterium]